MATERNNSAQTELVTASGNSERALGISVGIVFTGVFYAAVYAFPHPWIHRYFLGHWVCVAATLLFNIAAGILLFKLLNVAAESRLITGLRDSELEPRRSPTSSAADQWVMSHDAGRAAAAWLRSLTELPSAARRSKLVQRLAELLERQSTRATTRHLSDDIRELTTREAASALDSLRLIRIIVCAIPMLGFLGTVVGSTQTLGELDFSNGDSAIEELKVGLCVAFDTTAMSLVLSVVAVFLQFPVQTAEQELLGKIDRRIGPLLGRNLPADDAADPAIQTAQLCDGIRIAIEESLASHSERGMSYAMVTLANAVETLATKLAIEIGEPAAVISLPETKTRRSA